MTGLRHLFLSFVLIWSGAFAFAQDGRGSEDLGVNHIRTVLPGPAEDGLPNPLLAGLDDGAVVKLDLTLLPEVFTQLTYDSGQPYTIPAECGFGMLTPLSAVQIPTGSNHLLMTVMLGDPWLHAANRLSCEYAPSLLAAEGTAAIVELKGCYLVHKLSIPTAIKIVLHPLPAAACGVGN
jgi:hypothetical protein